MTDYTMQHKGFIINHLSNGRVFITHPDKFIKECYKDLMSWAYKSPLAAKQAITKAEKS